MRHSSIDYEELDPDNQDRPTEYYQGVHDMARYAANIIAYAYPDHRNEREAKVQALIDALWEVYETTNERRDLWFVEHMGAKFNPGGEMKIPEGRQIREEAEQGAH